MQRKPRIQVLCLALLILTAVNANAHNLFVLIERQSAGPDLVDVIFEHFPYPGVGTYNQPHLDRGKTWVMPLNGKKMVPVKLQEQSRLGKKFLQGKTETKSPRVIVHTCKWGVYKGRLDYFDGKYLDVASAKELATVARTKELPLDIVPTVGNDSITLKVIYKDKPLIKNNVSIWAPGSKETKQRTDAKGNITLKKLRKGTYSFAALHVIQGPTGKFDGKPYKGVMHGTTCSFRWPLK